MNKVNIKESPLTQPWKSKAPVSPSLGATQKYCANIPLRLLAQLAESLRSIWCLAHYRSYYSFVVCCSLSIVDIPLGCSKYGTINKRKVLDNENMEVS